MKAQTTKRKRNYGSQWWKVHFRFLPKSKFNLKFWPFMKV